MTNDLVLQQGAELPQRLVIRASHVTLDGNGATLVGPGEIGKPESLENTGIGILAEGCVSVTIRNIKVRGFATGLVLRDCRGVMVSGSDFSDNYHNPKHGWGELPPRGGILMERSHVCVLVGNRANRVWDGLHLVESHDNLVQDNDFSRCSNTCGKLWNACRNRFLGNNLSYGIRIDRAAGEVHARDSTSVLIESGSDDNYFFRNDLRYGGDGLFIRVLNGWVSRGNVFVENDTSYANNNCVESWSPGNTYIRNKANHGSYGFWLGGSDQTVLIGNEAAYNGLTNGNHNAPEPGFNHGGIVIVGGSSSHTLIEGNHCHDNNGAGLVFRGDVASRGQAWRTHHWIVQKNRFERNRFGLWGRWGDWIFLSNNPSADNADGDSLEEVTRVESLRHDPAAQRAPLAVLAGPDRAKVGQPVRFDATASRDFEGRKLVFLWDLGETSAQGPVVEHTFMQPGFYRLGLTVHNGSLASLAFRDLIVAEETDEIGTEGESAGWTFEMENNADGRGRVRFADDADAVVGRVSLRWTPDPYTGAYASAVYRSPQTAGWNWNGKTNLVCWLRFQNPNIPGWQNVGPVFKLVSSEGDQTLEPSKGRNLLGEASFSEARWTWRRFVIPLAGNQEWTVQNHGRFRLDRVQAIHVALDSWGGDPFTVWIDGLHAQ